MISVELALRLRETGLRWRPESGDRFVVLQPELDHEIFTISEMTIEAHHYPTGTVLGFNGTTEWALDSVAEEDALWLPREDQLRDLLGATFRSLARSTMDTYQVVVERGGHFEESFWGDTAAEAYALAVLALVSAAVDRPS
ncbi:pilus assembly protein CpaE [Cellulomonas composti]|uniref:pilus assembly protein CpaE n=1 Tax=Cellulomonas composti TaxID=266130 RepID=UPI0011BDEAFF|nr:pilus assembly protein CpaE [Cellulomonas composti]